MSDITQKEIIEWFDQTYKTRGNLYLRPAFAYDIFKRLLAFETGQKYLDVACGMGRMFDVTESLGLERFGVDLSPVAIEHCTKHYPKAKFKIANAEALPFPDDCFDRISCIGSLERIINLESALEEMHRVAKKNSLACFMVRNSNSFTWAFFKQFLRLRNIKGHQGAKSHEQWVKVFELNGFEIIKTYADAWPKNKLLKLISFGLAKIDYSKPSTSILPFKYANEYIFLLKPIKA